ncbi:hypothetical protein [Actinoplanes sp. G11-F43]|uniref:hypothetical protein n=1 Tax=Actinoplanes sp. G11-F43 TaxID=3424130 RepID=UPI003D34D51C
MIVSGNAWRGSPAEAPFGAVAHRWGMGEVARPIRPAAPPLADPWDWRHPGVGWGLVLPDTDVGTSADRAAARDAPECLRQLVADRGPAPVLRWRPDEPGVLLRYYAGFGEPEHIPIGGTPRGVAPGAIPVFLMLWGDPAVLPWSLQYTLGVDPRLRPGRLPLAGDALERYVRLLGTAWAAPAPGRAEVVMWSTAHSPTDITDLMRRVIAEPAHQRYGADPDVGVTYHRGPAATGAVLATALAEGRPDLVVTTSHGFAGPVGAPDRERLGWLVDGDHTEIDPAVLLRGWQPDGAVWYAHACCGAGADARTSFAGVFEPGSALDRMVTEVAGLGGLVAPFPVALLSAARPARAFVGHVEPTFDWTLRDEPTRHALTGDLIPALYDELLLGRPVGWAFRDYQLRAGAEAAAHHDLRPRVLAGQAHPDDALRARLRFLDRRALVVLGDPAVALPRTADPAVALPEAG